MANRTERTPKKKEKFLKLLSETGNVSRSAKAIDLSRSQAYEWKKSDDEFSAAWDDAIEEGLDTLEQEARRRAFEGCKKPIYQQGKRVGYVQEYSDTLMIFLLKGGRPEKYKDRHEHSGPGGGAIPVAISDLIVKVYGNGEPGS